jgi:cytidylate kinase
LPNIITDFVFAGPLGSGKSEVSREVAARLGAGWTSFGSTLRRIAAERATPIERGHLQELGEDLVRSGPEALCERVLAEAKPKGAQRIIIDGLRHTEIMPILRHLLRPHRLLCVYVEAQETVRVERIMLRDKISVAEIETLRLHSTEAQVGVAVRLLADCVVDNSGAIGTAVQAVIDWIETL